MLQPFFRTHDDWQVIVNPVGAVVDHGGWRRWYGVEVHSFSNPLFFIDCESSEEYEERHLILWSIDDVLAAAQPTTTRLSVMYSLPNSDGRKLATVISITKDIIRNSVVYIFKLEGHNDLIIPAIGATESVKASVPQRIWPTTL